MITIIIITIIIIIIIKLIIGRSELKGCYVLLRNKPPWQTM